MFELLKGYSNFNADDLAIVLSCFRPLPLEGARMVGAVEEQ
jgi:hypothetical protein